MLGWILYIAVLIVCTVFFVLYKDILALLLLCIVAAVPFVALITALLKKKFVNVGTDKVNAAVQCDNSAKVPIKIKNRFILPIERIVLNMTCENSFLNVRSDCKTRFSASPFGCEQADINISSEHIGKMNVTLKNAVVSDALNLFRFRKKLNSTSTVAFLPQLYPITVKLRSNMYMSGDADTYSKTKPGDDPSEVFDIREYKDGDKLNRIHWKLTVKQGNYMVREFSLPLNENILLYADLTVDNLKSPDYDLVDREFSELFSTAFALITQKKQFLIGWYDAVTKRFLYESVKNENELYVCMDSIFSSKLNSETVDLSAFAEQRGCSHICAYSSRNADGTRALLERIRNPRILKTAMCSGDSVGKSAVGDIYIYKFDSENSVNEIEI